MAPGLRGARNTWNLPPPCARLCDQVHLTPPSSLSSRPSLTSRPLCVLAVCVSPCLAPTS